MAEQPAEQTSNHSGLWSSRKLALRHFVEQKRAGRPRGLSSKCSRHCSHATTFVPEIGTDFVATADFVPVVGLFVSEGTKVGWTFVAHVLRCVVIHFTGLAPQSQVATQEVWTKCGLRCKRKPAEFESRV